MITIYKSIKYHLKSCWQQPQNCWQVLACVGSTNLLPTGANKIKLLPTLKLLNIRLVGSVGSVGRSKHTLKLLLQTL